MPRSRPFSFGPKTPCYVRGLDLRWSCWPAISLNKFRPVMPPQCPYQSASLMAGISSQPVRTAASDSRSTAINLSVGRICCGGIRGNAVGVRTLLLTGLRKSNATSTSLNDERIRVRKAFFTQKLHSARKLLKLPKSAVCPKTKSHLGVCPKSA
jgi:hypothetical protein